MVVPSACEPTSARSEPCRASSQRRTAEFCRRPRRRSPSPPPPAPDPATVPAPGGARDPDMPAFSHWRTPGPRRPDRDRGAQRCLWTAAVPHRLPAPLPDAGLVHRQHPSPDRLGAPPRTPAGHPAPPRHPPRRPQPPLHPLRTALTDLLRPLPAVAPLDRPQQPAQLACRPHPLPRGATMLPMQPSHVREKTLSCRVSPP